MGAGEPLLNIGNIINSMLIIYREFKKDYKIVRFAVASLIPTIKLMIDFTNKVVNNPNINCKFHYSMHFTNSSQRKEYMPVCSDIRNSLALLEHYTLYTGNKAEIHYSLIKDVNDTNADIENLLHLVYGRGIPVKFLSYNKKESLNCIASNRTDIFRSLLEDNEIETEFYIPPGRDIGSSCGMFLTDYYKKYNTK